jgi:hypothetical protein
MVRVAVLGAGTLGIKIAGILYFSIILFLPFKLIITSKIVNDILSQDL